jgi:regulator of RNase E activity RraA
MADTGGDSGAEPSEAELIGGFLALDDLTSTVSDAMDVLGIGRVVPASDLAPLADRYRVCGPAVTLRYLAEAGDAADRRGAGDPSRLGDRPLFTAASPGAVAVIDAGGRTDVAALGGIGASLAARRLAGIVVDGAVRDTATLVRLGLPVWCRGRSPVSGRHRLATVEAGGVVALGGVPVRPGDLVIGDSTGLCVVARERGAEVLALAQRIERDEETVLGELLQS